MSAAQSISLEDSYAHCVAIAKTQARNFHFAFQILPEERYRAICALYAFARKADDLSDDESDPARALAGAREWRAAFERALAGDTGSDPVLPALTETLIRFKIAPRYLYELLDGTELDATVKRYATWAETYRYCYLVASVIGIVSIHVFGFKERPGEARALKLAEELGVAFQLTNILRDIKEDAARGRIYLPLEDLARCGVAESAVLAGTDSPAFRELVRYEVARARGYYAAHAELLPLLEPDGRPALEALVRIYRGLLEEMERREYDVLSKRVSLSAVEKARLAGGLAWKTLLKS